MIVQIKFTVEADAASRRYETLVESWRAIYARALDDRRFGTAALIKKVRQEAYDIARNWLETERRAMFDIATSVALEATRDACRDLSVPAAQTLSDEAGELVASNLDYLLHELSVQVERDIAFMVQSLRRTMLQVSISARALGQSLKAALIRHRLGNSTDLHFFFFDRRSQKWPSRRFVRSVWRQTLLTVYNEIILMTLADHGEKNAMISHPDAKAPVDGMMISIAEDGTYPIYAEIRADVFHPNSDAILRKARAA